MTISATTRSIDNIAPIDYFLVGQKTLLLVKFKDELTDYRKKAGLTCKYF